MQEGQNRGTVLWYFMQSSDEKLRGMGITRNEKGRTFFIYLFYFPSPPSRCWRDYSNLLLWMLDQVSYSICLNWFSLIEWTEGEKPLMWADESGAGTPQQWDKGGRSDFSNLYENIFPFCLIFNLQFQRWGEGKKEGVKIFKG